MKKGNTCDLKKINYNKVNSNYFCSVSKVCASLQLMERCGGHGGGVRGWRCVAEVWLRCGKV